MDVSLYTQKRTFTLENEQINSENRSDSETLGSEWNEKLEQSLRANSKIFSKDVNRYQPNVDCKVQDLDKENTSFAQEKGLEKFDTTFVEDIISNDHTLISENIDKIDRIGRNVLTANNTLENNLNSNENQTHVEKPKDLKDSLSLNKELATINKTSLSQKSIVDVKEILQDEPLSISNYFLNDNKNKDSLVTENLKDENPSILNLQTRELNISGEQQKQIYPANLNSAVNQEDQVEGKEEQNNESIKENSLLPNSNVFVQSDIKQSSHLSKDVVETPKNEEKDKLISLEKKTKPFLYPHTSLYHPNLEIRDPLLDRLETKTMVNVYESDNLTQVLNSSEKPSLKDEESVNTLATPQKNTSEFFALNEKLIPKLKTIKLSEEVFTASNGADVPVLKPNLLDLVNEFETTNEQLKLNLQSSTVLNKTSPEEILLDEKEPMDNLQYSIGLPKPETLNDVKTLNSKTEFTVTKEDLSSKINDHFDSMILKGKNSEITFIMEPPETGKITVKLQFEGEKVQAEILSSHSEFLKDIERTKLDLIHRLQEKDIVLEKFEVRLTDSNTQFNDSRDHHNPENPLLQKKEFERVVRMKTINKDIPKVESFNGKQLIYMTNKGIDRVF